MIPQFMRFYSYTMTEVMDEYARTFFTLINSMFEIEAREMLDDIAVVSVPNSKDGNKVVEELQKRRKGLGGIIEEVKVAKGTRIINNGY